MRLTSFTDYGMRVMMRLASAPNDSHSTARLAEDFQVSRNHLAKVMGALAAAGFIKTRRGGGGGAVLARPATDIRLGEIVRILEDRQALVECFKEDGGKCCLMPQCLLRSRFAAAREAFLTELDRSTIADCAWSPNVTADPAPERGHVRS